jgi:hypothetical protein
MSFFDKRCIALSVLLLFLFNHLGFAGPPFNTDDPQSAEHKHWEYYISSISTYQDDTWKGTCAHLEINYGLIPNIQVHLLTLMNYNYSLHQGVHFGYAYTEFGIKYRFLKETEKTPQIGVFPILEIPTVKNSEFGDGKVQIFIPVWAQKSWGKLTSYGGIGYWTNPGTNNKNWVFLG